MEVCRIVLTFVLSWLCQFSYAEDSSTLIHPKDRQTFPSDVRIIGGHEVDKYSHPFQVALNVTKDSQKYFCSGTLLSNSWVLTAASCVDGASEVAVGLGVHNISIAEITQVWLTSTEFVVHDDYNKTLFWNDIALIKLPRNVMYNAYIQPIQYVGLTNETFGGFDATVMGWGKREYIDLSPVLNYVNVTIISNWICASYVIFWPNIIDSQICTYSGTGFGGTCTGDSGGPLIYNGTQIGIVSSGNAECDGKSATYTRVSVFSEWISRTIHGSSAALPIGNFFAVVSFAVFLICSF